MVGFPSRYVILARGGTCSLSSLQLRHSFFSYKSLDLSYSVMHYKNCIILCGFLLKEHYFYKLFFNAVEEFAFWNHLGENNLQVK